ncbi:MAG: signal peptide peptidase SppA [Verrucomicrobia bacterium]|nr:signal peptide peptidase SppA [Verrucomicrobiota bacterium]
MKNFFASCLGTIFGLFLFAFLGLALLIGLFAAAASAGSKANLKEISVAQGAFLVLNLSANITDAPPPSEFKKLLNKLSGEGDAQTYSLRQIVSSLQRAASDSRIGGVYLTGSLQPEGYGAGFAALREIRAALEEVKAKKKLVVAYVAYASKRDYYLLSVADRIYLNPYSALDLTGFASEPQFYADMFKKYGIGVQVTRVGKYKSAVEPYTRNNLSEENREQIAKLLGDLWTEWRAGVEQARKIPAAKLQELSDTKPIVYPEDAIKLNLATHSAHLPQVLEELRGLAGSDSENPRTFRQVKFEDYYASEIKRKEGDPTQPGVEDTRTRVAVVYAEGNIIDGSSSAEGNVAGDRFARQLRKLRQDNNVKAIVLRVNSPGGSAFASEVMLQELKLARDAGKPVVVSFGTVAASGGYYIACASDRIFVQPNTITGSIGVFGILPNVKDFANSWGVTFDQVKTSKYGAIESIKYPKTPEELAQIQGFVDRIYDQFIDHVAKARKMEPSKVKEIAQGRVWSGSEAVRLGLCDEVGSLEKAIAFAKEKASLPANAAVSEWPKEKEFAEQLAEALNQKGNPLARIWGSSPASRLAKEMAGPLRELEALNDPRAVYARMPFLMSVE